MGNIPIVLLPSAAGPVHHKGFYIGLIYQANKENISVSLASSSNAGEIIKI